MQTLDVVHDDQRVCIVMEYVHGVDLADAVNGANRLGERVPPNIASSVLVDVLKGLHAAHEARAEDGQSLGLVHRDVSPHNVVVGVDGVARVLDFGIAKALRKDHITAEGLVKGKVAYMAPEQLVGGVLTRQSDVYAAGVVLWEALTGKRLFGGADGEKLVARGCSACGSRPRARSCRASTRRSTPSCSAPSPANSASGSPPPARWPWRSREAVPPATSERVAGWLERVAADALEARKRPGARGRGLR